MKDLLPILILIMIFVIIFQIAKASEYVSVLKGEEKSHKQNNKVNAFMLISFLILGLAGAWWCNELYYPKTLFVHGSASEEGKEIDSMMMITIVITGIVFIITQTLLFWFSFKYQAKDDNKAFYYPHNNKLELIWTVIPAIVLCTLVVFGLRTWFRITDAPPKNAIVVEITGHQFAWEVRYPGPDGILGKKNYKLTTTANSLGVDFSDPFSRDDIHVAGTEMHIPVGVPVKLVINAQDVIHDVGLSHFRMKMDAMPGIPTTMWFTPNRTTAQMKQETDNPKFEYEISCDQMCGAGHFNMRGVITVDTKEDYAKWLAEKNKTPEYFSIYPDKAPPKKDTAMKIAANMKPVSN
jgi:cytochrome c oxidase subunit 2